MKIEEVLCKHTNIRRLGREEVMETLDVSEINDLIKRTEATISSIDLTPPASRILRILKRESVVRIKELNGKVEAESSPASL